MFCRYKETNRSHQRQPVGPSWKGADPEPTVQPQTKLGSSQAGFGSGGPTRPFLHAFHHTPPALPVATIANSGVVQSAPFRGRCRPSKTIRFSPSLDRMVTIRFDDT